MLMLGHCSRHCLHHLYDSQHLFPFLCCRCSSFRHSSFRRKRELPDRGPPRKRRGVTWRACGLRCRRHLRSRLPVKHRWGAIQEQQQACCGGCCTGWACNQADESLHGTESCCAARRSAAGVGLYGVATRAGRLPVGSVTVHWPSVAQYSDTWRHGKAPQGAFDHPSQCPCLLLACEWSMQWAACLC